MVNMKEEKKLLEKIGRSQPWTVPDGYFDSLSGNIIDKLPEYPEKPHAQDLSTWQRLKPYVYLAAMFAGIWCMMQIFHHAGGIGNISLDNPPEHLATYMASAPQEELLLIPSALSDEELIDEMSSQYSDISDFERDFGVTLEPEYENIEL